jgi:hypothetical protein
MTWEFEVGLAIAGMVASAIAVLWAMILGRDWFRYLPKIRVHESLAALLVQENEVKDRIEELRDRVAVADAVIRDAEKQQEWMEKTRDEVSQLESWRSEIEGVDRELSTKIEEAANAEEKLQQVVGQISEKEASLNELVANTARENDALEKLARDREASRNRLTDLNEDIEQKNLNKTDLEHQISVSENEKRAIERLLQDLQRKAERLEGVVSELERTQAELRKVQIEFARLEEEVARKETAVEELTALIATLGEATPNQTGDESQRTALLWDRAVQESDFGEARPSDSNEQQVLQNVEDRIKDSGLIYHPRVIRAFHTALKCSEESPLLVLAGISGTGKSALPGVYSKAIGMHSLKIPVQPGWDSPADLMGFYNHLEQKFKPTELTRALIQMDASEHEEWPTPPDWKGSGDRMLMVLLDEMNLARVEYYFSEFLSRLEDRSGLVIGDEVARRKASLQLELGGGLDGRGQVMRVLPGNNVLFVGTMNEDESTQTLSDKVIDRSNIMRFGRPRQLSSRRQDDQQKAVTAQFLSKQTWLKWIENAATPGDEVEHWIEKCNGILAKVRRPFAHRVAGAMYRYVQLYPNDADTSIRHAMADQIELRVLPRLRGLDLHEKSSSAALEETMRFLRDDLDDIQLADALSNAVDASKGMDQLFVWSGVDRGKERVVQG